MAVGPLMGSQILKLCKHVNLNESPADEHFEKPLHGIRESGLILINRGIFLSPTLTVEKI